MPTQPNDPANPQRWHERSQPIGPATRGYWAREPAGRCLVFIHGFNGDGTTTWIEFPVMLQIRAEMKGTDLVFYSYDGLHKRARASAFELLGFLTGLLVNPAGGVINPSCPGLGRREDFQYETVVLVAHSLGALVARLALLEATLGGHAWVNRVQLVLFAPAHKGAHIARLASTSSIVGGVYSALEALRLKKAFQVLMDLEEDCDTVKDLRKRTVKALRAGSSHLTAKAVFHADGEGVVPVTDFLGDPTAQFLTNATHFTVCKPHSAYLQPLDRLASCL